MQNWNNREMQMTIGYGTNSFEGLQALMTRQGVWQDEFGTPFVNSETEFGITMGFLNGGLYAMHHLIDSL